MSVSFFDWIGFDVSFKPTPCVFSILRLSIARAIYQNSSILVLDEATSALDSRSELLLKEALMNLMASHTVSGVCSRSIVLQRFLCLPVFMMFSPHFQVVIIAHRLEMILMADRIVLLEGGKLREITRSAFLSLDGRFGSPPDVLSRELGEAWDYEGKVVCCAAMQTLSRRPAGMIWWVIRRWKQHVSMDACRPEKLHL